MYGADAVAGVVNFVLNTHYEGVKVDANYGFNNHKNNNRQYLGYLRDFGSAAAAEHGQYRAEQGHLDPRRREFRGWQGQCDRLLHVLEQRTGGRLSVRPCRLYAESAARRPTAPSPAAARARAATAVHRARANAGGAATTLVDNAVDPATGAFRPYQRLRLLQLRRARATSSARPSVRRPARSCTTTSTSMRAVYTETMYARNTSTAQYGPSGDFFLHAYPLQLRQSAVDGGRRSATLCTPATLRANQAISGLTWLRTSFRCTSAAATSKAAGAWTTTLRTRIRQVIGVKGAIRRCVDLRRLCPGGHHAVPGHRGQLPRHAADHQLARMSVAGVPAACRLARAALTGADPTCVPWNIWTPGRRDPGSSDLSVGAGDLYTRTPPSTSSRFDHR